MMSRWRTVERLRAFARAALTVLAALLPFEKLEPLARDRASAALQRRAVSLSGAGGVGPGGGGKMVGGRARPRRADGAGAVRAPRGRGVRPGASGFGGPGARRAWDGAQVCAPQPGRNVLYAAAADLLRAPGASVRAAKALVGGAVVAALLAVTEARSVAVGALLHSFHLSTFEALGRPRASGPFQYPNIAAMYLEAVAPIAAALGAAAFVARQSRLQLWGAMLVLLLLLDGVLATASRAGLVGGLAAVAALAALYGRRGETRALAPALLATMLALAALASGSELVGRFRFWKDGAWYRAVVTPSGGKDGRLPPVLAAGSTATESLDVQNQGGLVWVRVPPCPVVLSYHWLDANTGAVVVRDGLRTDLPRDLYREAARSFGRRFAPPPVRAATFCGGTWCRSTRPGSVSGATQVCASRSWSMSEASEAAASSVRTAERRCR